MIEFKKKKSSEKYCNDDGRYDWLGIADLWVCSDQEMTLCQSSLWACQ